MNTPDTLKYTKEHEWVRIEGEFAYIGITDFAQGELGEIVYVEVETVGETIERDEVFGTVEAVKTTSDLFMPLTGEVVEFNPKLDENDGDTPDLINTDPYGDGFFFWETMDFILFLGLSPFRAFFLRLIHQSSFEKHHKTECSHAFGNLPEILKNNFRFIVCGKLKEEVFNRKSISYISLISLSYTFLLDFFGFGLIAR